MKLNYGSEGRAPIDGVDSQLSDHQNGAKTSMSCGRPMPPIRE